MSAALKQFRSFTLASLVESIKNTDHRRASRTEEKSPADPFCQLLSNHESLLLELRNIEINSLGHHTSVS
jgi:hypothetical protein